MQSTEDLRQKECQRLSLNTRATFVQTLETMHTFLGHLGNLLNKCKTESVAQITVVREAPENKYTAISISFFQGEVCLVVLHVSFFLSVFGERLTNLRPWYAKASALYLRYPPCFSHSDKDIPIHALIWVGKNVPEHRKH